MQKYLFSKIMLLTLAASALSAIHGFENTYSTREKISRIGLVCAKATNDFGIGFATGAVFTFLGRTSINALMRNDSNNQLAAALAAPIVIGSAGVAVATHLALEELEVIPSVSEMGQEERYKFTKDWFNSFGIIAGFFAVNSFLGTQKQASN